jgi:hypothetical protein
LPEVVVGGLSRNPRLFERPDRGDPAVHFVWLGSGFFRALETAAICLWASFRTAAIFLSWASGGRFEGGLIEQLGQIIGVLFGVHAHQNSRSYGLKPMFK